MQVKTVCDAPVLKPNRDHKNFSTTDEIVPRGTVLEGIEKYTNGLRRGEPFTYKLFVTKDEKIIHLKNVEPMKNNVEVLMNADGNPTGKAKVSLQDKNSRTYKVSGAIIGAIAGFGVAELKKKPLKTAIIFAAVGAAVGFGTATLLSKNNIITAKNK